VGLRLNLGMGLDSVLALLWRELWCGLGEFSSTWVDKSLIVCFWTPFEHSNLKRMQMHSTAMSKSSIIPVHIQR
jgi:hypothetical protein